MSQNIQSDLLNAHADALVVGDEEYYPRYATLFSNEMAELEPLFEIAEQAYTVVHQPIPIRAEFRAELKADLLAQMHQQQTVRPYSSWHWAALGASVTVAGVIAAATWRTHYSNRSATAR